MKTQARHLTCDCCGASGDEVGRRLNGALISHLYPKSTAEHFTCYVSDSRALQDEAGNRTRERFSLLLQFICKEIYYPRVNSKPLVCFSVDPSSNLLYETTVGVIF